MIIDRKALEDGNELLEYGPYLVDHVILFWERSSIRLAVVRR